VVVTRLSAIEELAGVDILCSNKTGTLTQNKLTLGDPFTVNSIPADQVVIWAALASRAEDKDTIDLAVIGVVKDDKVLKSYRVLHFQPELPQERDGTVANVVFPTGIDRRDYLSMPNRFDVYYGMADNRIGVRALTCRINCL
jgi:magnesium-transporting ATPase (P-type)